MKSILTLFILALFFLAAPALATDEEKNPTLPAQAPEAKDTCYIEGTLTEMEKRIVPQYYEAPSIFNDSYQRLTVRISKADVHDKHVPDFLSNCRQYKRSAMKHFKLCSTVEPQVGDHITGIVGQPENSNEDACLFDLKILGNIMNKN